MSQRRRAEDFRRLHEAPELLVLPNVWDAASARTVAALPRCRALATASWAIAAGHGLQDGGAIGADAMVSLAEVLGLRCGRNEGRACLCETRVCELFRNGLVEEKDPPDREREKVDLSVKPARRTASQ